MQLRTGDPADVAGSIVEAGHQLGVLRFLTCGSVDDGKSTFIGRLMYDCGIIADDAIDALAKDSRSWGTTGEEFDFALLVDGLQSEREQGITIDVAYRYFATPRRKFIIADTPGHEQYTRNMATGASRSDLAVVLIDARKGLLSQTRRHSFIARLLGIRHVLVAVNKMDLVGYGQAVFAAIAEGYREVARQLGIANVVIVPVSALRGANLTSRSPDTPWYQGPTVLEYLETVDVERDRRAQPMRLPVQLALRANSTFRGYAGTLVSGQLAVGDLVTVLPSKVETQIASLALPRGPAESAVAGEAVVVTLATEVDAGRGSVLVPRLEQPEVADQFVGDIVWFSDRPLLKGRPYLLMMGPQSTIAQVSDLKHAVDIERLAPKSAKALEMNEIGRCSLSTAKPLVLEPYARCRDIGGFILIDRMTNETVGAGMIAFALRRAQNVRWQALDITREQRAALKGQRQCCLWFTGLSGSGKSTIANELEKCLHARGHHTFVLDGDNVRHGLNSDLGFTDADRVENIRRVAEVARLMADAGLITIVSFISPFRAERQFARERFAEGEFLEVFVDTPLATCEARDPKGLYAKARSGAIPNFTGISSPYEPPSAPEFHLSTVGTQPEKLADSIVADLSRRGII